MKMLHQDTNLLNFPQKLHENQEKFGCCGGGAPGAPLGSATVGGSRACQGRPLSFQILSFSCSFRTKMVK